MKYVFLLMALFSTGCYTCQHPTEPCAKPLAASPNGYMVVNNSGAIINLVQDGQVIASRIEPGQVVPLRPIWMRTTSVVAVGYTPAGEYVGTDSYIFASNVRETWTIHRLNRPQTNLAW
jgi:hypothetical protein